MNEQIKQALGVLMSVVNAATQKGVFNTAEEASVANSAIKLLVQAATPPEDESKDSESPAPKKKGPKKVK